MSSLIFTIAAEQWAEMKDEWDTAVEAQIMAADQACNGYLLNKRGKDKGIEGRTLFTGSESRAYLYASEELVDYWEKHPRITLAWFERQWLGARHGEN